MKCVFFVLLRPIKEFLAIQIPKKDMPGYGKAGDVIQVGAQSFFFFAKKSVAMACYGSKFITSDAAKLKGFEFTNYQLLCPVWRSKEASSATTFSQKVWLSSSPQKKCRGPCPRMTYSISVF